MTILYNCPFCGFQLHSPLKNGISFCLNCNETFESNLRNELLSMSWGVRKYKWDFNKLADKHDNTDSKCNFVYAMVAEEKFSHDEVIELFSRMGITETIKKMPRSADVE